MDKEEEQVKQDNSINNSEALANNKPEHHPSLNGTAGNTTLFSILQNVLLKV